MKKIELPRIIIKEEGAALQLGEVLLELKKRNPLIVARQNGRKILGEKLSQEFNIPIEGISNATIGESKALEEKAQIQKYDILIAIGGGTAIDCCKLASFNSQIEFISIPTSLSHDGMASPISSVSSNNEKMSIPCKPPIAVLCDLEILKNSPKKLLCAGIGDAISNYTAVLDWKIGAKNGEEYGEYAAALSSLCAARIIRNAKKMAKDEKIATNILAESLIASGAAMSIAGSSRPASGAEHQFSHALDKLLERPALHGEQCGIGTILMAKLHGKNWKKIRETLKIFGAPTTAKELETPREKIIEALTIAHRIRNRTTILGINGLSEKAAESLAIETGVI